MNCPFCHKSATLTAYGEEACDFECQPCQATYICDRFTRPQPHRYHSGKFFIMHDEKKYTIYLNWQRNCAYLEYNAPNLVDNQIAMWDFIPNLNPQQTSYSTNLLMKCPFCQTETLEIEQRKEYTRHFCVNCPHPTLFDQSNEGILLRYQINLPSDYSIRVSYPSCTSSCEKRRWCTSSTINKVCVKCITHYSIWTSRMVKLRYSCSSTFPTGRQPRWPKASRSYCPSYEMSLLSTRKKLCSPCRSTLRCSRVQHLEM